eukprot:COSAG02_NODE_65671_length_257_cov_0.974684_2_plen_46_part_01
MEVLSTRARAKATAHAVIRTQIDMASTTAAQLAGGATAAAAAGLAC